MFVWLVMSFLDWLILKLWADENLLPLLSLQVSGIDWASHSELVHNPKPRLPQIVIGTVTGKVFNEWGRLCHIFWIIIKWMWRKRLYNIVLHKCMLSWRQQDLFNSTAFEKNGFSSKSTVFSLHMAILKTKSLHLHQNIREDQSCC